MSAAVWGTYNLPRSVDVVFANGGITGPGGHPIRIRERLLEQGVYEGFTKETLKDHAYYVVDSEADIEAKWPLILQYRPDFLKLMLVDSEHYAERRDDPAFFGLKGLNPQIFARLVEKAHQNNLRVSVHINSAYDFHAAVSAGVEEIAHLPGYREPHLIDKADAAEAARRGIVVVTTAGLNNRFKEREPERYARVREAQIANLRLLKEAGVKIAVGSDEYDDTSVGEVAYLQSLSVFDNAEILRMWTAHARTCLMAGASDNSQTVMKPASSRLKAIR
jgi:Imidazolonepropionase and related amidohydrolases